jgi:flagellar hook-associated protein 1 FlgK
MQVNPDVVDDPSLVAPSATGTVGDNGTAKAIADLRTAAPTGGGGGTLLEAWSALVFAVGNDTRSAEAQKDTRDTVMTQLAHLRDQAVGVSLDDEAAALMRYQRAFEANAQYFAAINDTLMTLMTLVGGR